MSSLKDDFEELWQRIRRGRGLTNSGDDPVYYLVFRPAEMIEVKRQTKQWIAKLKNQGWTVESFSMSKVITQILKQDALRDLWLTNPADKSFDPDAFAQINQTLADVLMSGDLLKNQLASRLAELTGKTQTLLFVTDLESLHPYLRVGALEQKLQGKFTVPTVFLYPGVRDGKTTLRFLAMYPADGNYRSVHVGG